MAVTKEKARCGVRLGDRGGAPGVVPTRPVTAL